MKFQLTYEIHFKFILDCKQYSPWLLFVEEGWSLPVSIHCRCGNLTNMISADETPKLLTNYWYRLRRRHCILDSFMPFSCALFFRSRSVSMIRRCLLFLNCTFFPLQKYTKNILFCLLLPRIVNLHRDSHLRRQVVDVYTVLLASQTLLIHAVRSQDGGWPCQWFFHYYVLREEF